MKKLYALLIAAALVACESENNQSKQINKTVQDKEPKPKSKPKPKPESKPKPEPKPIEIILQKKNMHDALAFAKPFMRDEFETHDLGTLMFWSWSSHHLFWSDVNHKDETSIPLIRKDPSEARGKHYCASGRIIQITTNPKDKYSNKSYTGLLLDNSRNLVHFYAVHSSGSLVERSPARICGIVTGVFDYSNSGGGTSHAIKLVGIFDLPENK